MQEIVPTSRGFLLDCGENGYGTLELWTYGDDAKPFDLSKTLNSYGLKPGGSKNVLTKVSSNFINYSN